MRRLILSSTVCLMSLAGVACVTPGNPPPSQGRQPPEQAAEKLRQTQAQATGFVSELSAAVRAQPRNEAWASARERELRQSYAQHPSVPKEALKGVECRQSRCELQFAVAPTTAQGAQVQQQALAIDQWAAWSQPCGYTLTQEPGTAQTPGSVRVFLECEQ